MFFWPNNDHCQAAIAAFIASPKHLETILADPPEIDGDLHDIHCLNLLDLWDKISENIEEGDPRFVPHMPALEEARKKLFTMSDRLENLYGARPEDHLVWSAR